MKEGVYQSIECSKYDLIEISSMRKKRVEVEYYEGEEVIQVKDVIETLFNNKHGEFLRLQSDKKEIRLDRIISFNGKEFGGTCGVKEE